MLNFDQINVGSLVYVLGDWDHTTPFRYLKVPEQNSQKNVAVVTGKKIGKDGKVYIEINNFQDAVHAGVVQGIDVDADSLIKLLHFEEKSGVLEKTIASNYQLQYHLGQNPFFTYSHGLPGVQNNEKDVPSRYDSIHELQNVYPEILTDIRYPPSSRF